MCDVVIPRSNGEFKWQPLATRRHKIMTEIDTSDLTGFIEAIKNSSAEQILQFGSVDDNFVLAVLSQADWSRSLWLHCVASPNPDESAAFDERVSAIKINPSIDINLTKHLGSSTEINDEVLSISEESPFDAIFISGSSSPEELLTAFMVSNESLKAGGAIGFSKTLIQDESMAGAISSFLEMYGDYYDQPGGPLLVKN